MKKSYSREEFENVDSDLDATSNEIVGHKTVEELRALVDTKEGLEHRRQELITDAHVEARIVNIFVDTLGDKYKFGPGGSLDLEMFLLDYTGEHLKEVVGEVDAIYDLLEKDSFAEADFELMTDSLTKLRQKVDKLSKSAQQVSSNKTVDTEKSGESQEKKDIEIVKTKDLVYQKAGGSRDYHWPSTLYAVTEDNKGERMFIYVGDEMRKALGIYSFTRNRRELIKQHMPKEIEVETHLSRRGNRYGYLTARSLEQWVSSIRGEMPTPAQVEQGLNIPVEEVEGEFLPVGEWPRVEGNGEDSREGSPSVSDPERVEFLSSLSPIKKINATKCFGGLRTYTAFVYERADKSVVVLATDMTRNADYVFWNDEASEWIEVARRMKLDVITGSYPQFVGRLIHSGDWKSRLKSFLAGEKDTLSV